MPHTSETKIEPFGAQDEATFNAQWLLVLSRAKARRLDLNSGTHVYGHGEGTTVSPSVSEKSEF